MSAGSLFQKFDCKETVAGEGPRVQVCFYKMVGCELVYILRGNIDQVEDSRDRVIDGWEALDRGGGWDPEPLVMN